MDTECINGRTEIDMRENGRIVSRMAKEQIYSLMEIPSQGPIKQGSQMVLVSTSGSPEVSTLVSSRRASNMARANGKSK
jgi:hypothetical protein